VRDQHPGLDLRIIFQDASKKITKNSPTTYGMWATKHGFKWGQQIIPFEWMEEAEIIWDEPKEGEDHEGM